MSEIEVKEAPLTGPIDGEGGVYLNVANESFECRKVAVTWHMMRFAKAQRSAKAPLPHNTPEAQVEDHLNGTPVITTDTGRVIPAVAGCEACAKASEKRNDAGMDLLGIMHDMLITLLKPYERERFIEFMETAGLDPDELEDAIGEVIAEVGGAERKAKTQPTSSHSSTSPDSMNGKSPAILSEPVTERVIDPAKSY